MMDKERIFRNRFTEDDLYANEKLCDTIIKILNYSILIDNDETRYLFLANLISSDNIVDVESANKSLETLMFLKQYNDLLNISNKHRKEMLRYVNKGIRICKQDITKFRKYDN